MFSINYIMQLCYELGIVPTKDKGQNFLVDDDVVDGILRTAHLDKGVDVLEIGPGLGVLTERLVKNAHGVVAIEYDKKLFAYLKNKFNGVENLRLLEGDALQLLKDVVMGKRYKVVANLPYQISSHILRLLLELPCPPQEMILMLQKEVGERLVAQPGEMSILSVAAQYHSQVEIVRYVGRDSFWPVPKVDSVVVRLEYGKQLNLDSNLEKLFFKLVKIGFANRRKMLKNNLSSLYSEDKIKKILDELNLNFKVRAQELSVQNWGDLVKKLI